MPGWLGTSSACFTDCVTEVEPVMLRAAGQRLPSRGIKANGKRPGGLEKGLKQRHGDNAGAFGFGYEKALKGFVLDL